MANKSDGKQGEHPRDIIAKLVLGVSIAGLGGLAGMVIVLGRDADSAKDVLNVMLPVFAAWVGTILAFYFSRENFEAATRSVRETIKELSPLERLRAMPVREHMIKLADMDVITLTAEKTEAALKLVEDILGTMNDTKRNRLPILTEKSHPKYIIHRSMIDKFLSKRAVRKTASEKSLESLTLENLLSEDKDLKQMFETSFAVVNEDATLAEAKCAMENVKDCLDIFVTKNGTKEEPVLGWITNLIITKCAKL
jgi:hypothetical protein